MIETPQEILMRTLLIKNTEALSFRQKKLKNNCTSSALIWAFFLLLLIPTSYAVEDIPPPPNPGENTRVDADQETPPPPLPIETTPTAEQTKSIMQTHPPISEDVEHPSDDSRNIPEPEVNIIHRKNTTIEEYRVNGKLRYVKIIPKIGKPYYLVDKDGDGSLETRHNDLDGIPPIAEWILIKW